MTKLIVIRMAKQCWEFEQLNQVKLIVTLKEFKSYNSKKMAFYATLKSAPLD